MPLVTVQYDQLFVHHLPLQFGREVAQSVVDAMTFPDFELTLRDIVVELRPFTDQDWHPHADLLISFLAQKLPHREARRDQYATTISQTLLQHFTARHDPVSIWVYVNLTDLGFAMGDSHYGMHEPHPL